MIFFVRNFQKNGQIRHGLADSTLLQQHQHFSLDREGHNFDDFNFDFSRAKK